MLIICGPQTATVGYTSMLVCNKLVKIDNIQSTSPDMVDLILEGGYVSAYTSGSALRRGNEIWILFLLSKNVPGGTVNIKLTISSDPCAGVTCPDKCVGSDLWNYRCNPIYDNLVPAGYECVQDSLNQANSPQCIAPTHYVSMSLGFVPPELITYFETYISAISDNLMTYIAPPPSPWEYVKTTYDRITNSFNLWFYIPATAVLTMAPGGLQDIYNWFAVWVAGIIGVIFIIIGLILAIFFTGPLLVLGLISLFAGVVVLVWRVYDAVTNEQKAETVATNLTIQIEQNNKEDQARNLAESLWNKSAKTQSDCTTRLQTYRDAHLAKINGFLDQYAKYPFLVTELTKLKDTYTTNANRIITEFKAIPYAATTCDTYFVRLNSEIGTSTVAINDALGRNINPAENYSIACKGWTNQAACEKADCFWYDSACHKEEACWIGSPLGGCVLSAGTGKTIVGVTVGLVVLGAAYWLLTRKRAEVTSIYVGAKEAVTTEAARAKAAYREIRPPAVPRRMPVTALMPPRVPE